MEHGRGQLECDGPAIPQDAEQVHGEDRLGSRPRQGGDHGRLEEHLKEAVPVRVDAVENDRDVREEFRHDVKST